MLYEIAITLIEGIGNIYARTILSHCGSGEAVFKEKRASLAKIPKVGPLLVKGLSDPALLERAEAEMKFISKNNIRALLYSDTGYPSKLRHCDDAPVILYTKGNADFTRSRVVSIVGTRSATPYGLEICAGIVRDLAPYDPVIVSGLALGIDSQAHRSAVDNNLETWAAVGHSLDRIYPSGNTGLAREISLNGAVVSEYVSGTKPDKENFPMRNRIVAGLADVTIVVETAAKGGSMITADLAAGYFRDVFAVPGRINEETFSGCHRLIQENRAMLFTGVDHLAREMGWQAAEGAAKPVQASLLLELTPVEQQIIDHIREKGSPMIDDLSLHLKIPVSRLNAELLSMELKGMVKALPGKRFSL
jgi:DNA processing protein